MSEDKCDVQFHILHDAKVGLPRRFTKLLFLKCSSLKNKDNLKVVKLA